MAVSYSNEEPPPGSTPTPSSSAPPASESQQSFQGNQQSQFTTESDRQGGPSAPPLPNDPADGTQSGFSGQQSRPDEPAQPDNFAPSDAPSDQTRPLTEGAPHVSPPPRRVNHIRRFVSPRFFAASNPGTGNQNPMVATTQAAISTILGRGASSNIIPGGVRTGSFYFISFEDDETQGKASAAAIRRLRTVPLSEIPADERQCTICYEPLEEVPEEAVQQQMEYAAVDEAAENARSENERTPGEEEEEPPLAEAKDGHAPLQLPCKHSFGASCVRNWLQNSSTCPLCRTSIEPRPAPGVRRHVVQQHDDLDRLWATIMRPYNNQNQNQNQPSTEAQHQNQNQNQNQNQTENNDVQPNEGATNGGSSANEANANPDMPPHPQIPLSVDFSEIVNALNIHLERHLQHQTQQQPHQPPNEENGSQGPETDTQMTDPQTENAHPGAQPPGEQQGAEQQPDNHQRGVNQTENQQNVPQMHFHLSLDDMPRENMPQNADSLPQEFIFDIRIMPQADTFFINRDGEDRAPDATEGGGFAALRASQREEMLRAVYAAAEESLHNRRNNDQNRDAPDTQQHRRSGQHLTQPMVNFNPTLVPFDNSDSENSPEAPARPEMTGARLRQSNFRRRASQGRESSDEPAQEARASENTPTPPGQATVSPGLPPSPVNLFLPPSPLGQDQPRGNMNIPYVRGPGRTMFRNLLTEAANASRNHHGTVNNSEDESRRQAGQGPNMSDSFVDEGLFQAFRRHFDAPDGQQDILQDHLNERLPPPTDSPNDSMVVDSDVSRSGTLSTDAPAADQSEENDMSRSGPTRRSGRRHHPYPRS